MAEEEKESKTDKYFTEHTSTGNGAKVKHVSRKNYQQALEDYKAGNLDKKDLEHVHNVALAGAQGERERDHGANHDSIHQDITMDEIRSETELAGIRNPQTDKHGQINGVLNHLNNSTYGYHHFKTGVDLSDTPNTLAEYKESLKGKQVEDAGADKSQPSADAMIKAESPSRTHGFSINIKEAANHAQSMPKEDSPVTSQTVSPPPISVGGREAATRAPQ